MSMFPLAVTTGRWPGGLFVAGMTGTIGGATPGDHAVAVAVITAVATVVAVVIGPLVTSRLRNRRSSEDLVELLVEQLDAAQKENAELRRHDSEDHR